MATEPAVVDRFFKSRFDDQIGYYSAAAKRWKRWWCGAEPLLLKPFEPVGPAKTVQGGGSVGERSRKRLAARRWTRL